MLTISAKNPKKQTKKPRQANGQLGPKSHLLRMVPPAGKNQDLRTGIGEEGNREKEGRRRIRKRLHFGEVCDLLVL